jgi:hypothetical protein
MMEFDELVDSEGLTSEKRYWDRAAKIALHNQHADNALETIETNETVEQHSEPDSHRPKRQCGRPGRYQSDQE